MVSDVIPIPMLFLHVRETRDVASVDCDMVLHRNINCYLLGLMVLVLEIICGYFSILEKVPVTVRANG